jgi:excinuclease ABC subunit B
MDYLAIPIVAPNAQDAVARAETLESLRSEMLLAAEELDFERAAQLRDRIVSLRGSLPEPAKPGRSATGKRGGRRRR